MSVANFIDQLGTNLNLPEWGISEALAGGKATVNTNPQPPTNTGLNYNTQLQTPQTNNGTSTSSGGGFDKFNSGANPGDGWGWFGPVDGWKQIGEQRDRQSELSKGIFDRVKGIAERRKGEAKGYLDELLGKLGERRNEFGVLRQEGEDRAIGSFEDVKRQLATNTAEKAKSQDNRFRAMGIQGSGILGGQGKIDRDFNYGASRNRDALSENEATNQRAYKQNLDWANAQESVANRNYQDAINSANDLISQGALDWQGNEANTEAQYANSLNNLMTKAMEIAAMNKGAGEYSTTPFNLDMSSFLGSLNGNYGASNQNQTESNQARNVVSDNNIQELLKKIYGTA